LDSIEFADHFMVVTCEGNCVTEDQKSKNNL